MRRPLAFAALVLLSPLARADDDEEVIRIDVPALPSPGTIKKDATPAERVTAEFLVGNWVSDAKASARAASPDLDEEMLARLDGLAMPLTTYRFTKTSFEESQTMADGSESPFKTTGSWTLSKDGRTLHLVPTEGEPRELAVSKRGARLVVDAGFMVMLFNKR